MATRQPPRKGPEYGMKTFAGSRQPDGPTPRALALLKESGNIVDEPASGPAPPKPSPPEAPEATDAAATPKPSRPSSRRSTRGSSERKPRRKDKYILPDPGTPKVKLRSNHFRLPADIEEYLEELSSAHGCSRTHVVCSVIASEWQRLKRRQSRSAKVAAS